MAAIFRRSSHRVCQCQRSFSTSSVRPVSLQWDKNDPEALKEAVPPYPYGPTRWYKQSRLGLYGGQRIQFGNNVGEEFKTKTRRSWQPNIFTRKLFSKALNRSVQVRVSARVLRTIDKLGGLDEYLLGEKEARLKELGESGWWLRWAIMQTPAIKKRFAEERRHLGLPEEAEGFSVVEESLSSTEDEVASFEQMEAVAMDNAFQVEQTKDLPSIKFRVGPGQHVMLTSDGWRRTRPAESYFAEKRKEKLMEHAYPQYVEQGVKAFTKELERRQQRLLKDGGKLLSEKQRRSLINSTTHRLRKELKGKIEELLQRRVEAKDARKMERRREKYATLGQKIVEGAVAAPAMAT